MVVLVAIIGGAVKTYALNRNERQWNETVANSTPEFGGAL